MCGFDDYGEPQMKPRRACTLKPGVYEALLWEHNKHLSLLIAEPHDWFTPGCRVQSANVTGMISLDFLTIFDPNHKLYNVRRLM